MMVVWMNLAIAIPWYLFIHLMLSTTASRPTSANLSIPIHDLKALIFKIVLGLILPSVLVALPEKYTESLFTRQVGIALWQLWPCWATLVHYSAMILLPSKKDTLADTRSAFRYVYGFTFGIAAITHIVPWVISLTATYVLPQLNGETIPMFHPKALFMPALPWLLVKPDSIAQGSFWLIQWDHIVGSGALYWWCLDLYRSAHTAQGKRIGWMAFVLKTTAISLFSGFTGAAVMLLWEREEMILEAGQIKEKVK